MQIIKGKREELEEKAAELILAKINSLTAKYKITFAIPGGRSVEGIFSKLYKKDIDWKKVHFFMIDERLVTLNSKNSNFIIAREVLFQPLLDEKRILGENIHPFVYTGRIGKDIKKYKEELNKISKKFDIILLSAGEDGHVASLFPHNLGIQNKQEFIHIKNSPKPPKERMSASLGLLQKSDFALTLFFGETKREAFNKFIDEKVKIEECPAKLTNEIKESYILTDIN